MLSLKLTISACLAAVVCALSVTAAPAHAAADQQMTFEAPSELLGDATRDATLDEIKALGVDTVRVLMYWKNVAPSPDARTKPGFDASDPAAYPAESWAPFDRLLDAADRRGMKVFFTLTGPVPKWATKKKSGYVSDPSSKEFGAFATAVGRRYGDRVETWSIWNEPNHPQFLGPQFVKGKAHSPRLYRGLYMRAVKGLRSTASNANDTILIGETAPRGTGRVVAPLAFLRGALCLNSKNRRQKSCDKVDADGYAHHAYTTKAGPKFRPPDRDDVTIGVLSRLVKALDAAGRAGAIDKRIGIHLTEFGVQSKPDPFVGVSLMQQAEYRSIAEHIAFVSPRVRLFSQYLLRDDQPRPGSRSVRYSGFETGLRTSDGTAKPAYDGFRLPLVARRIGSSDVLWGIARPARGATSVTVQYKNGAKGDYKTLKAVTTNASGVWTLRTSSKSGRRYRVVWTASDGTTFEGPATRAYR